MLLKKRSTIRLFWKVILSRTIRALSVFLLKSIMRELRLLGVMTFCSAKLKEFIYSRLFDAEVDLNDKNVLRNLSEIEVIKTIIQTFKK